MSPVDFRPQDSACARRKLLSALVKPPPWCRFCSLWFLLLLGAGSLLLLVNLQDLTEPGPRQNPGASALLAPRWPQEKVSQSAARISWRCETGGGRRPPVDGRSITDSATDSAAGARSEVADLPPQRATLSAAVGPKRRAARRRRKLLLKTGGEERRRRLARAQDSRRRLLTDVCAKYQPGAAERPVARRQVSRVYVEDRSRLLYCEVPKAGCSNWKRVLMVLGGSASSARDIPHDAAHYANRLRRLETYDGAGIAERLRSYTKVLFVREPFERLVSAFRDKFESPNSYYHPVFGRPIISRYRTNATRAALRSGAGVTFREFVQYLLDVRRPVGLDIHWEPVSQLCHPCLLRYNFIGKFERLEEEANFLLRRVGAPGNLTFPDFKDRNPRAERTSSRITQNYFSQLNATERQKAFDFYYMDYVMFDYPKPFADLH